MEVVMISQAVGTVIERAMGRYEGKQTGENSLQRTLRDPAQMTKPEWQPIVRAV